MKLDNFTIFLTDTCNFNCRYCYQKRGAGKIQFQTIKKALDFFFPFFKEEDFSLDFYGGEPLLAWEEIKATVKYLDEKTKKYSKKIRYSFTTNGSLINEDILYFLNKNKFKIMLSFDGMAQNRSRQKGSFKKLVSKIKKVKKYTNIELSTNSVFTPMTLKYMTESMKFLIEDLGIKDNNNELETVQFWEKDHILQLKEELVQLRLFLYQFYKTNGYIPVRSFRPVYKEGIFWCSAGRNRMSITPNGKIWGCYMFHNYFKGREKTPEYNKYCFGNLNFFINNYKKVYKKIMPNFVRLRMNRFFTDKIFCMLCEELEECRICPIYAGLTGSILGKIPSWQCEIEKLIREGRKLFLELINSHEQAEISSNSLH